MSESAGKITTTDQDKGDNAVITYDLISEWGNVSMILSAAEGLLEWRFVSLCSQGSECLYVECLVQVFYWGR